MNTAILAKEMGVKENDVVSLLNMVYSSIKEGGFEHKLVTLNEEERIDAVMAYVSAEIRKFNEFCQTLLTNSEKSDAFNLYVLSKIR